MIPGDLPKPSTHHANMDDSRDDLQVSVTPNGLTRSCRHVKAISGGSDTSYMSYMNWRWCRRVPKVQYVKTQELIEADRMHLNSTTTSQAVTYHIR